MPQRPGRALVEPRQRASTPRPAPRLRPRRALAPPAGALARSSEMRAALRKANLPGGAVNQFMEADLLDDLK
jgi:hypothetical protein